PFVLLPARVAAAAARVEELRASGAHARALELLSMTEAGCDAAHVRLLLGEHERDPLARAAGAAGAADAVHVALVVFGRVEVDDVADRLEVESARRDVGGDERRRAAAAEALERPLAGALGHVAVHRRGLDAAVSQL